MVFSAVPLVLSSTTENNGGLLVTSMQVVQQQWSTDMPCAPKDPRNNASRQGQQRSTPEHQASGPMTRARPMAVRMPGCKWSGLTVMTTTWAWSSRRLFGKRRCKFWALKSQPQHTMNLVAMCFVRGSTLWHTQTSDTTPDTTPDTMTLLPFVFIRTKFLKK